MKAMIIADDLDEREILSFILRRAGLAVAMSASHKQVLSHWIDNPADLILFSLKDTATSVMTVEEIRSVTQIPLLMIVDPVEERILCELLETGADVVLFRPVSPKVLTSNIKVMGRRTSAVPSFVLPTLSLKKITLDPSSRSVVVTSKPPKTLTRLEFRLLYTLMTNRGQVVPNEVIAERVWGYMGEGNQDLVRGLISRLRRKIDLDPSSGSFIETVSGVGYRFIIEDE